MSFVWDKLLRPAAFRMDAEHAHELGIRALAAGLAAPFYAGDSDPVLECERFGLQLRSPLGVAAGFDKNGVVVGPLERMGFGFVEVGTVTARPQPGNPKPRLFRLPDDRALINRLGFNNDGAAIVAARLSDIDRNCVVGVNIGRNKNVSNENAIQNYLEAFDAVSGVADYVAVNVSSPNTSGLRELQHGDSLDNLVGALQARKRGAKPLLVKIAPDLDEAQLDRIVEIALRHELAGIIATNTTTSRQGLRSDASKLGDGGLSGAPLAARSNEVIRRIFRSAEGKLRIIGVGGVFTAEDALEKITAGACLVQAYTGFAYGGPGFPKEVNRGLARLLVERGFSSVDEAVGTAAD
ncbi:MAG TPA: quinone-dependent dihydroorotate dehydrogenase [Pyrinomonadaceae bacterium]|nr:quinone-dependent dihydroorotate dehydrogenase [Pyrinomonadaceae bacterium]